MPDGYTEGTRTCEYRRRYNKLRDEQSDWRAHWLDIAQFVLPRRGRYLQGITVDNFQQEGQKKHQKIINGSAVQALKTLAGGLQGGLTSPARPWFSLTIADEALAEFRPVREWLHMVQMAMLSIFARSNFYSAIHYLYWELGGFGTAAMFIEEDYKTVIRCRPMTIGEYVLALDDRYRANAILRQFSMSAEQMQIRFGKGENKLGGLPNAVKYALMNGNKDTRFEVQHVVEENARVDTDRADYKGKKFKSVYYPVAGDDEDQVLREDGYSGIPFIAPRWDVTGVDTYGSCPTMDALGDIKQLQKMEEKKLMALDKMVNPPMNAPVALKNQGATTVSGGVNWVDVAQGGQSFIPAYQVNPNLQQMAVEIDRVEHRIRGFFFNDLFLSVTNAGKDMTAFEVARRHEEKLMMLGPIIERQQSEALDMIIDRVFEVMVNLDLLPPIPNELKGRPLKVNYISLLAQAQKMVATAPLEQLAGFAGNLAKAVPGVLKKINFDEVMDQYATALGVPPKCINSDEQVAAMTEQERGMQRTMMLAENAKPISEAVKNASETPVAAQDNGESVLSKVLSTAAQARPPAR